MASPYGNKPLPEPVLTFMIYELRRHSPEGNVAKRSSVITKTCLKITYLKRHSYTRGAIELAIADNLFKCNFKSVSANNVANPL